MPQSFEGLGPLKEKGAPPLKVCFLFGKISCFIFLDDRGPALSCKLHRAVVLSPWVMAIDVGVERQGSLETIRNIRYIQ